MHHRAAADFDVHGAPRPALDIDDRVLHGVAPGRAVRNGVQLTGFRVALGVRGVPAGQCPAEVAYSDGVQLVGEFVVRETAFDQSNRLAGVSDHVGVGADGEYAVMAGRCGFAECLGRVGSAHPAIAVPLGLAVADADAVHHAITDEPVVELRIDLADRVGAVSQIPSVEVVRDRPDDLEVGERVLLVQWGEFPLEIAAGHGRTLNAAL